MNRKEESEEPQNRAAEFVYVEEEGEWRSEDQFQGEKFDFFTSFENLQQGSYPLPLRVLTFCLSFVLLVSALLVGVVVLLVALLGGVTLFRVERLNVRLNRLFKFFAKLLVFSLGLFVASFNPPYGIALVLLYFTMKGQKINQHLKEGIHKFQGRQGF